ncbi:MAG: metallophosphoesterase [Sphingomonadaceae bacterium]
MLIAQVTDLHLGFDPGNEGETNRRRLDAVLGYIAAMRVRPDMVFATGDLVEHGDVESYRAVRDAFESKGLHPWPCLGNHDVRANFASVFPEIPLAKGFCQYEIDQGDLRILVLDTLEEGRHGGAFCSVRARWLSARLSEQPERPTAIVMHHPPVAVGIDWLDVANDAPWVARFQECIAGRTNIVGVMCGHLHRPLTCRWNMTTIAVCAATAPQIVLDLSPVDIECPDDRPMLADDPPAYALHRWDGHTLVTHFDTVGPQSVLARFDSRMQPLLRSMMAERAP